MHPPLFPYATALAVFVMGLRHGADPDHLAAIDNLTRNASEQMPRTSRFVGTFFALGHGAMIMATAALAAAIGAKVGHASAALERAGAIASIVVLLLMAVLNVIALIRSRATTVRSRLLPKALREARHPLIALPVGALFGLGFETSSQLVAYGVAFSSGHLVDGLLVGAAFCLGMIGTDTFDSLFVARVVATRRASSSWARRVWILVVTLVALAVAAEECASLLGVSSPVDELTLSGVTVGLLAATGIAVALVARARPEAQS
jgi:nickel/cobalt transporter (NiCoT) family protein